MRRLAAASAHRDRTERQLAQDARRLAGRHAAELDEIEDVLQQCGLTPQSLPTAISSSLGARLETDPSLPPARPLRSRCAPACRP